MFVHLNNHSDYSLQRSISTVKAIVERTKEIGQKAVAITDYGNLFATAEFASLCKKADIKAIIGCECAIVPDKLQRANRISYNLIFLAMNDQGFENLKILSSIGFLEGFYYYPRIDLSDIKKYHEGLICIIPQNESVTSENIEFGKMGKALEETQTLKDIFGDRLYLEIQNHGLTSEIRLNQQIKNISEQLGIPLVAENDCHYINQNDSSLHDIFINTEIKGKKKQVFSSDQYYMKSREEMELYLQDYIPALDRTLEIADRCEFVFNFIGPHLPKFEIPQGFPSEDEYLRHITWEGIHKKYPEITDDIKNRVEFELGVIIEMKYSGYFLIVWDIIAYAHKELIPVGLGRGSAAGSIIAYALGITNIDPLKYGLLFERFLNPERVSMPDIDTDFCVDKRQEVIEYIRNKYGSDHVSQIITFSQLKPKGALRDVARVLNVPLDEVDVITKLIPFNAQTLVEAEQSEPKLQAFRENQYRELFDATEKIVGLHRHASLHAAGIVIGASKLTDYVPLYRDTKSGAIATQYSMKYLEDCGLVKMDILGLRTLTIIDQAVQLIRKEDPDFSIETIPEDDQETFSMLSEGKSDSVFQFESGGMQRTLIKVQPTRIEDLIALNALYRPGPIQFIDDYAQIKQGKKKVSYIDDALIPILEETYGIIIYQEQVMEIARKISGYTLASADLLRRAMGKKDVSEMEKQLPIFIQGAMDNGFSKETAQAIYDQMKPFAEYGFNKSHSAAYAILAYQTAYLKRHYPVHFMTAAINSNASKPDELSHQLKVAKSLGITILAPDVNYSQYLFSIEGNSIRYGLNAIKGMSEEFKQHIPVEREKNGTYSDVLNCLERLPSHRALIQFLKVAIPIGLFDSLEKSRATLLANIDLLYNEAYERLSAKLDNRNLLFTDDELTEIKLHKLSPEEEQEQEQEIIAQERELLGTYLTHHPLDTYRDLWMQTTTINSKNFNFMESQKRDEPPMYMIGYVDTVRKVINAEKKRKTFLGVIEDFHGEVSFMLSTKIDDNSVEIEKRKVYGFIGYVQRFNDDESPTLRLKEICSPEELLNKKLTHHPNQKTLQDKANYPYREMHINIMSISLQKELQQLLQDIHTLMLQYYGDTRVIIHISDGEKTKQINLPPGFTVDAKNKEFIEKLNSSPLIQHLSFI